MPNPNIAKAGEKTQFKKGESGNPNGKPKGTKSLSTIILEMESEEFDWSHVPVKPSDLDIIKAIGAPWRAIVYTAIAQSLTGNVKAMEWLRKAGYGDKLDLTSAGQRIKQTPVIVSDIKARHVETESETTESPGVS